MNLKITATTIEDFKKIEESLNLLNKDFKNKFSSAKYMIEGFSTIELINDYSDDIIRLPKDFTIGNISFKDISFFNKNKDGEIKEDKRYQIEIEGTIENQCYKFIYTNLYKYNRQIVCNL